MPKPKTSWSKISGWYDKHLQQKDNYHNQVVLPKLAELVRDFAFAYKKDKIKMLDIGCGQGAWIESLHQKPLTSGWEFVGVDVAEPLIKIAQAKGLSRASFKVAPAENITKTVADQFDLITCVLALQNMEHLQPVFAQVAKLLKPGGEFVFVITHPSFRIPKHSDWVDDRRQNKIYRGAEKYMSNLKIPISSRPFKSEFGEVDNQITWTFHRPLQDYVNLLGKNGLAIVGMHEWVSHKKSEAVNPKAKLEDAAREEIPMFMCVVVKSLPTPGATL